MKFYGSALLLLLSSSSSRASITRSECVNQGGEVIGDIGNGAIFQADYVCENSGQAPTDSVTPDSANGPFASEGEVCCGGTGEGISVGNGSTFGDLPGSGPAGQSCTTSSDCPLIQCLVAPCPDAVCVDGLCSVENNPPSPECVQDSDCPVINCFVAPCDVNVCDEGICELRPPPQQLPVDNNGDPNFVTPGGLPEKLTASRQECTEEFDGEIVGDIGDGAIMAPEYMCASSGAPPVAIIVPAEGEPIASEGEVCCGLFARATATRQECTEELGGEIVGDIGNGAIFARGYICESSGEPPIADVMPSPGEPIAMEGEVCCGTNTTTTMEDVTVTPAPSYETTSDAGNLSGGSVVASVIAVGALFMEVFVGIFIEDAFA